MIDFNARFINGKKFKHGGCVYVHKDDYECLYEHCKGYQDYVEIGTMFGGSAIIAGYAVKGQVHCIEPFGVKGNPFATKMGEFVSVRHLRANWEVHHDLNRLVVHKQKHPPWPESIDGMFDVGLIDGDHTESQVWKDWEGMKDRIKHKIFFHDVRPVQDDGKNPTNVFHEIIKLPEWELLEVRGVMGVVRRVK